jgi:hypothetical protein
MTTSTSPRPVPASWPNKSPKPWQSLCPKSENNPIVELPIVVAALGQHGDKMNPNQRKVHAAQMAVGKSTPVVASIDTIPIFFPKEKSPGGRDWNWHNNAESFLLIGEAMSKAMVALQKK